MLSSHPVFPRLRHGEAAESKKGQLLVPLTLELPLSGAGASDYLRTHLLHLALMGRKTKRNFWKEL